MLCDIDDQTLNIDLDKAQSLISRRTKAIIVMDYDCILCDHEKVNHIREVWNKDFAE